MTRKDAMLEICRILLEFEIEQRQKVGESVTEPTAKAARPADCASRRRAGQGR